MANEYLFRERQLKDYCTRLYSKQTDLFKKKKEFFRNFKKEKNVLENDIQKVDKQFNELDSISTENNKTIEIFQNQKKNQQNQIENLNLEYENLIEKHNNLVQQIIKCESVNYNEQIEFSKEQIESFKHSINITETQIEETTIRKKNLQKTIESKKKDIVGMMEKQKTIKQDIDTTQKQRIKSNNQIKNSFVKIPYSDEQDELQDKSATKHKLEQEISSMMNKIEDLGKEELTIELNKKKTIYETKTNELEIKDINDTLQKYKNTTEVHQIKTKEYENIQQKLQQIKNEEENIKNQMQTTQIDIQNAKDQSIKENEKYEHEKQIFDEIMEIYMKMEKEIEEENSLEQKIQEQNSQFNTEISASLQKSSSSSYLSSNAPQQLSIQNEENTSTPSFFIDENNSPSKQIIGIDTSLASSLAASGLDLNDQAFARTRETKIKEIQEVYDEMKQVKDEYLKLLKQVSEKDSNNRVKETEIAKLIRAIKQCLKLPPDLVEVLNGNGSSKSRFKNSNDIVNELKTRNATRDKRLQTIKEQISTLEINIMNKQRQIQNLENILKSDDERRLKMILFINWMNLLVNDENFSLETFSQRVDFILNVFNKLN